MLSRYNLPNLTIRLSLIKKKKNLKITGGEFSLKSKDSSQVEYFVKHYVFHAYFFSCFCRQYFMQYFYPLTKSFND